MYTNNVFRYIVVTFEFNLAHIKFYTYLLQRTKSMFASEKIITHSQETPKPQYWAAPIIPTNLRTMQTNNT